MHFEGYATPAHRRSEARFMHHVRSHTHQYMSKIKEAESDVSSGMSILVHSKLMGSVAAKLGLRRGGNSLRRDC